MVQLILEDVTLIKGTQITVHVRFKGGATRRRIVREPCEGKPHARFDEGVLGTGRCMPPHRRPTLHKIAGTTNR